MNHELFEKRILFESMSHIMLNQNAIMKHLGIASHDFNEHNDYLVEQCDAIVNRILWEESVEH